MSFLIKIILGIPSLGMKNGLGSKYVDIVPMYFFSEKFIFNISPQCQNCLSRSTIFSPPKKKETDFEVS